MNIVYNQSNPTGVDLSSTGVIFSTSDLEISVCSSDSFSRTV